jgi:hypothetical protein
MYNTMYITTGIFFLSLVLIVSLFGFKLYEERRGILFAPAFRSAADRWALTLKGLVLALRTDASKIFPELVHLMRILIHEAALALSRLLRRLSAAAHALADLVSHKHAFERRAPRSAFLTKVAEHKRENGGEGESRL